MKNTIAKGIDFDVDFDYSESPPPPPLDEEEAIVGPPRRRRVEETKNADVDRKQYWVYGIGNKNVAVERVEKALTKTENEIQLEYIFMWAAV